MSGKEYINSHGKTTPAKEIKAKDCSRCSYKCSVNVLEHNRKEIFDNFWSFKSYERQKDFICKSVIERETKTLIDPQNPEKKKRRNITRYFKFDVDNKQIRVCKGFFMATLNVGKSYIDHALKHCSATRTFNSIEKRGRHTPANKTSQSSIETVRKHIESFPALEGHYVRKSSQRKYLAADLNIKKMIQLYIEKCKQENVTPVSKHMYRKVSNEEYINLSFHVSKKDQCAQCNLYNNRVLECNGDSEKVELV